MRPAVSIQEADFDVGAEIAALGADSGADGGVTGRDDGFGGPGRVGAGVGAVASFVGLVRADKVGSGGTSGTSSATAVQAMTLEHYPGMTEQALEAIVAQANGRWQLGGVRVIHRVGRLLPGDRIVFVGVASSHRHDAFAACEFIMDYLKTQAPFWKREETQEGARWVDARESDDVAAQRWSS